MRHSEECAEIFAALSEFAGAVLPIDKDATNKFIGNRYASIGNVMSVARPALAKTGLALLQEPTVSEENVVIETMIVHKSGQWLRLEPLRAMPVRAPKGGAPHCVAAMEATTQEKAAAYTYLRRYAVLMALGLAGEDDTDGEPERVDVRQQAQARPGGAQDGRKQAPGQREPAQQQQELRQPQTTHRMGPEVDQAVNSLAEATTIEHLAILGQALRRAHGAPASTIPWIAFDARCQALGKSRGEVFTYVREQAQKEAEKKAESSATNG